MSQDQRIVLVTGATSGIGAAAAKAFAASGDLVVLAGRRTDRGEALVQQIEVDGGKAAFIRADVAVGEHVERLVSETVERFGGIDVAFINAGIEGDMHTPTHEQTDENFDRVFDVNVKGVLRTMRAVLPHMLRRGRGAIINNASIAGHLGFPGMSVYAASKHAVIGLTRTAALEYGGEGIRVNAVAPGPIKTEMWDRFASPEVVEMVTQQIPAGRPGEASEIASAVRWLADPSNTYTNGQVISVDGGYSAA